MRNRMQCGRLTRNSAFLVCFMIACTGTLVFQCWPISAAWSSSTRDPTRCFSNSTFSSIGLANSSINCATDFLLAVLPIPVIVHLHVNKRTKITLVLILSLGYFACAAGIVKAVKQADFFLETDPLWHNKFNVWNMIELCLGITAASLPGLRPLFAQILVSTKGAISLSWGSKDHTLATHSSAGYRRHRDREQQQHQHQQQYGVPPGVALHDLKNLTGVSSNTDFTKRSHATAQSIDEDALFSPHAKSYTVGVTAIPDPRDDDESWGNTEVARTLSRERLARPHIFKTTQVAQTSHYLLSR
jgi:hypothetical protein